jgi:hypothetical protein
MVILNHMVQYATPSPGMQGAAERVRRCSPPSIRMDRILPISIDSAIPATLSSRTGLTALRRDGPDGCFE